MILGKMFAASVVLIVLGAVLTGQLLKRGVSGVWVGLFGALLVIAGTIVIYSPGVPATCAIVGCVVAGAGGGILTSWLTTRTPTVAPSRDQLGTTGGILSQLLYLGMFLGPPVVLAIFGNFPRLVFYAFVIAANITPIVLLAPKGWLLPSRKKLAEASTIWR
jgi:MFS family permease